MAFSNRSRFPFGCEEIMTLSPISQHTSMLALWICGFKFHRIKWIPQLMLFVYSVNKTAHHLDGSCMHDILGGKMAHHHHHQATLQFSTTHLASVPMQFPSQPDRAGKENEISPRRKHVIFVWVSLVFCAHQTLTCPEHSRPKGISCIIWSSCIR